MLLRFLFVIYGFFLTSCVSTHTALQKVEHGLDKQRVRDTIGKPFSVGRSDGLDRWTYKFRWNSQEYTRDVFFDEGRVQKVGPLTPYPNYEKKMKEAESLEEYERNAQFYQRQKEAGFREINSEKKKQAK
ncbi:MAG: outer membrane protein assembly factor BamE [Bdellovibrionales bacterium]|nr:outer membrane protein assembly factor BamE [Bdellovibrionales bacterium]